MEIYRTAIPMRRFEHAAASRRCAEAVVVRMEFADGRTGWGETLPRDYVTGETLDGVVRDLQEAIWQAMQNGEGIPLRAADGRCIAAAACAADLARYDAPARETPPGGIAVRVSGVLGSSDPARTAKKLRHMRWFGLRDFKLKLGFDAGTDRRNLEVVARRLSGGVKRGKVTLRVDVNGAWSIEEVPRRIDELRQYGVCVVEQPVYCPAGELAELAARCSLPLMADESLIDRSDAEALVTARAKVWWNIRISKNGGLSAAADLAALAAENGIPFVVGCMVGETSVLSAAQRRLLQGAASAARFVEGNYGRFLLAADLTDKSLRFGYGGRIRPIRSGGLGVRVNAEKLSRYGQLVAAIEA